MTPAPEDIPALARVGLSLSGLLRKQTNLKAPNSRNVELTFSFKVQHNSVLTLLVGVTLPTPRTGRNLIILTPKTTRNQELVLEQQA